MHNQGNDQRCQQIAVYQGASGRRSTYPVRDAHAVPASIVSASGEVRQLVALESCAVTVVGATAAPLAATAA